MEDFDDIEDNSDAFDSDHDNYSSHDSILDCDDVEPGLTPDMDFVCDSESDGEDDEGADVVSDLDEEQTNALDFIINNASISGERLTRSRVTKQDHNLDVPKKTKLLDVPKDIKKPTKTRKEPNVIISVTQAQIKEFFQLKARLSQYDITFKYVTGIHRSKASSFK
ncbi:hypothetical protein AKO1_012269 [Acrasis kona]|uniref:Uncharacterized protein n=1 Tax=Acrasis kona TaxID=1008807 RepID=A0AAW2Z7R2_9EUKA